VPDPITTKSYVFVATFCHLRPSQPRIPGSRALQPLWAARLPQLQLNNMSCGGGSLLGISQWESEKEERSFGGERRTNAPIQTAGQLADNR
jgi:hypothetical protein